MTTHHFHLEHLDTPTGPMLIVTDQEDRLRAIDWEDHESRMMKLLKRHYGADGFQLSEKPKPSVARRALQAYFEGDLDAINDLPTETNGTDFQRKAWAALRRIPCGQTRTYGAQAAEVGQPKGARAVGLANGSNPIAIVVPCHRVIGANASMTGFGGGIERKRWLLAHEQARSELALKD